MNDDIIAEGLVTVFRRECPLCGDERYFIRGYSAEEDSITCEGCGEFSSRISGWPHEEEATVRIALNMRDDISFVELEETYD